ncbi:MAG: kynureninase [Puniceicoccaceae bacterium]
MQAIEAFLKQAEELDAADPLAPFRTSFTGLDSIIYLDGNSLGPLPRETAGLLSRAVEEDWAQQLIRSWNNKWHGLPEAMGDLLAPLLGAAPGEVCFADSVTVNLFKLSAAALAHREGRGSILTDDLNFPSDLYTLNALLGMLGNHHSINRVASWDGLTVGTEDMVGAITEDTALVTVSHVVFKSGFMHDLKAICSAAHEKGALVLADVSHSVGSVPINLSDWGVDMAVGCSYKFLNGGPGAPAFLYVRKDLQESLQPQLAGWFGTTNPFQFNLDYEAAKGIRRFLVGTPPIISLQAVEPGIRLLLEAGIERIREKSIRQSDLFLELFDTFLEPLRFELGSPRDSAIRGSHIAFRHPEAFRINKAMIEPKSDAPAIIPDFRTPDNLRLGIAPLFLSYSDIVRAAERIRQIVVNREYEGFDHAAGPVT